MAQLQFYFSEFIDEINVISEIARKFVYVGSDDVLNQLRITLDGIRGSSAGKRYRWEISQSRPLNTVTSWGKYEREGRGQHPIYAEITSIWEIEPIGPHNPKSLPPRMFKLAGLASTKVRLYKGSLEEDLGVPNEEFAMWRMEIGNDDSPGCHFHVQVLGESDHAPFPHSLSVPRLPGLLMTPMAVIEYVLGEIFQDEWKSHAARTTPHMDRWRAIQKGRLSKVFNWECEQVRQSLGAPLTALKWAKPPANLCLGD